MNIIVISLERAADRRECMKAQLASLGLDAIIMDAVDGQNLSQQQKDKKLHLEGGYRYGEFFKPGEIGCTMSHINALKMARMREWPYVIVLEDDIILAEDFSKRINFLFKIIPGDWEHIYLSGIPRLGFAYPNLQLMNVVPSIFTECTLAMIIRNTAYDKIIDYLEKFETTTDDSYNHLITSKQLISYTFYPFAAYAKDNFTYIWDQDIARQHKSKLYFKNKI